MGIPLKAITDFTAPSRSSFRSHPIRHRSEATLAPRLCGEVIGYVNEDSGEAER
jgi:hypothetical protein